MTDLVVVGAGVAGLSAAWHAQRIQPSARITVLEASRRAGGLVETERTPEGFLLEHGPDSLMIAKPAGMRVAAELGIDDDVVRGDGAPRRSYLVDERDRMIPIPEGLMGASPSAAWELLKSPLLSPVGKMRMLLEPWIAARPAIDDESVDEFFRRRFGTEMAERIVDPLLRGIYGASTRDLGIRTVLPRLAELERTAGSVARGSALARQKMPEGAPKGPPLVTFREGMGELTEALARAISGPLHTGAAVRTLGRSDGRWALRLADGSSLSADLVVLAIPAWAAARVIDPIDPDLAIDLAEISHAPLVSVSLAWKREDVPHPMDGTGFVVSPRSGRAISACTWSSRKWPGRAPDGDVLIRAFLRDASIDDPGAVEAARRDLRDLMGIEAEPLLARVRRRQRGLPRCGVGHQERVARMAERAASLPGLALAGNAHGGVGVPDCIESGARAASALLS